MALLVDDLLALSRVGSLPTPDQPVDTNAELNQVLKELKRESDPNQAEIIVGELPTARIPGVFLDQIFQNLIGIV